MFVRALQFAVWIVRGITQSVPALPRQDHPERRAPVMALDHGLHLGKNMFKKVTIPVPYLTGLHHTPKAGLDLLEAVGDVVVVDAAAAVVNQDGAEAKILGVECGGSWNKATFIIKTSCQSCSFLLPTQTSVAMPQT